MAKFIGTIDVQIERCKGCGVCIEVCPKEVIKLSSFVNSKGYNYCELVNQDDCVGCSSCGIVCPDSCITVYRKKVE